MTSSMGGDRSMESSLRNCVTAGSWRLGSSEWTPSTERRPDLPPATPARPRSAPAGKLLCVSLPSSPGKERPRGALTTPKRFFCSCCALMSMALRVGATDRRLLARKQWHRPSRVRGRMVVTFPHAALQEWRPLSWAAASGHNRPSGGTTPKRHRASDVSTSWLVAWGGIARDYAGRRPCRASGSGDRGHAFAVRSLISMAADPAWPSRASFGAPTHATLGRDGRAELCGGARGGGPDPLRTAPPLFLSPSRNVE